MLKQKDIFKLLAYAAVINGYIHSEQLLWINKVVKNDKEIHEYIYEILLSDETYDKSSTNAYKEIIQDLSEQLRSESKKEQNRLKRQMLRLMCYDGNFDEKEQELMSAIFPGIKFSGMTIRHHMTHFQHRTSGSIFSRFIERIKSKICKNVIPFYNSKQLKFEHFIKKITDDNCHIISNALLQTDLSQLSDRLDKYCEELYKINRNEATIVVIGKTKAGKSTLFSLISGAGSELIGKKGRQRTSKCTIVTHYKGVKIVDTPGLAAAAKKGDVDEKVAMNACDSADGILFLIPTDTYGEELEFIKKLVYMNKPISVLFNCKNNDWFEYRLKKTLSEPGIWKKGDADNNIKGWANQLLRYSSKHYFSHIFEKRIYYSFFRAAEIGSNKEIYPWVVDVKKKIPPKKRKEIYEASDFEKCMSDFITDFTQKAKIFRLAQITSTSIKLINDIKTEINMPMLVNENRLKNVSKTIHNINSLLDSYERQCKACAEDEIKNILSKSVLSNTDVDENLKKLKNGKFEEYITSLLERINEDIYRAIEKIAIDETNGLNRRLNTYGINQINTYRPWIRKYTAETVFRTKGNINPLKSKEFYILPMAGLGRFTKGLNLPATLAVVVGEFYVRSVIDKKASSITSLKDKRALIRWQETAILFDNMVQYYTKTLETCIHDYGKNIRNCNKSVEYSQELSDCLKKKKDFEIASDYLEEAKDITLREFSVMLLKICQRRAKFIRYAVSNSEDFSALEFNVYAKNCKEKSFNDMRHIIHIKKGE